MVTETTFQGKEIDVELFLRRTVFDELKTIDAKFRVIKCKKNDDFEWDLRKILAEEQVYILL